MTTSKSSWRPLQASIDTVTEAIASRQPCVFRQRAAHWTAVREWSFERIAALGPDTPVQLVQGNRELDLTVFCSSTLGAYLCSLRDDAALLGPSLYLKEFDLLKTFKQLEADLRPSELFPRGSVHDRQAWIGPAGACTGLHHDFFDNLAVQILGRKRFYLLPPGSVERLNAVSAKHDNWSRLASQGVEELFDNRELTGLAWVVDLEPGDILYVPARWWHEVVNHTSSILLSGFFGPRARVYAQWVWRQSIHRAHLAGFWRSRDCTCHPAHP